MKYVSLFSGIEAATVAWEPLGWEPLAFSEIDAFPCAVLAERFPGVPNLGDITKIDWKKAVKAYGKPDVVVGGSPCQSFSIAGGRTGLDGASGLMWEYVRAVRDIKPRWLLWENVPGALSSTHGEDFRCLLEALDACGYGLAWRVLDAQFFGVAQRRERLFVVGRLGDVCGPCEVLFEPESLRWDTPSSREKRKAVAEGAGRGADTAGGALNPADPQSKRVFSPCGVAPTLSSGTGQGMNVQPSVLCIADNNTNASVDTELCGTLKCYCSPQMVSKGYGLRRLTPRECERLQGFPDDWTLVQYRGKPADECPDGPRYKAIGNSMAVPVMRWIGERIEAAERGKA